MPSRPYSAWDSRDVIADFYPRFEASFDGSWVSKIATVVNSDRDIEEYKFLGRTAPVREWTQGRTHHELNKFGMTLRNKTWEQTLEIDVEDLRQDKTGQLSARVADMARVAALHPEKLISTLIMDGDGTTGLCYDGQEFFDTDHSEGASGTQKNDLGSTEIPSANVTTATAPTPTEAGNVIVETIAYMMGWVDDTGEPVNGEARDFIVMAGTASLYSACVQAVRLNNLASGAMSPVLGLTSAGLNITPVFNPRLSADTAVLCVFRADAAVKPFILQRAVPLETQLLGAGSEYEAIHNKHLFGVKMVHNAGYGMWNQAARVTLT